VEDYPTVPEYRFELAEILVNRARVFQDSGRLTAKQLDRVQADLDAASENLATLVKDHPGRPDYALRAADVAVRRGLLDRQRANVELGDSKRADSGLDADARKALATRAEEHDRRAIETLTRAIADVRGIARSFPEYALSTDYRLTLSQAIRWLGFVLRIQSETYSQAARPDLAESLSQLEPELKEAVTLAEAVLKDDPTKRDAAGAQDDALVVLYDVQFSQSRYKDALSTAQSFAKHLAADAEAPPAMVGEAGRLAARCLSRLNDPAVVNEVGAEIVNTLTDAYRRGLDNAALLDSPDFAALRERPDFQALVRSVKSRGPAKG
jgi:hypothetical protein